MVSIFTSSKELVFKSCIDSQILLQRFRKRIEDDSLLARLRGSFSPSGVYVGTVDGRDITVRIISMVHNPLEPTLQIHVGANPKSGSEVTAWYTTSTFVRLFLIVWMVGVICLSLCFTFGTHTSDFLVQILALPCFGAFLVTMMRLLARHNEKKLADLVRYQLSEDIR